MSDQAFGWIVEVTDYSGAKRYHVAIRNRVEAVNAVRRRVAGAAKAHVEGVTMLSQRAVTVALRLKPGEVALITQLRMRDPTGHQPTRHAVPSCCGRRYRAASSSAGLSMCRPALSASKPAAAHITSPGRISALGHDVRLILAQYVKAFLSK